MQLIVFYLFDSTIDRVKFSANTVSILCITRVSVVFKPSWVAIKYLLTEKKSHVLALNLNSLRKSWKMKFIYSLGYNKAKVFSKKRESERAKNRDYMRERERDAHI